MHIELYGAPTIQPVKLGPTVAPAGTRFEPGGFKSREPLNGKRFFATWQAFGSLQV